MATAKFTVDTHLFRELGELLVGRDSTALIELIKNAYDADATEVIVYGEALDDRKRGYITISDNGVGMTPTQFEEGFLRIASRSREEGLRHSVKFSRRYTGAKGVGRLAAHKLAAFIEVESTPSEQKDEKVVGVEASINWDHIEKLKTLDEVNNSGAITLNPIHVKSFKKSGTTITLRNLRRSWTRDELGRFLDEVRRFKVPTILIEPLTNRILDQPLLFERPQSYNADNNANNQFDVLLEGDFKEGDVWWQALAEAAQWVIEIVADRESGKVRYAIGPTRRKKKEFPDAEVKTFEITHPHPNEGPFFQARIMVREGSMPGPKTVSSWARNVSGINVFLEGFRILPYGEPGNDWLSNDSRYAERARTIEDTLFFDEKEDRDIGLSILPNRNYCGAVFLTQEDAPSLRLVVSREGFIPERGFNTLVDLVKKGIDFSVRVRASVTYPDRKKRRESRLQKKTDSPSVPGQGYSAEHLVKTSVDLLRTQAHEVRKRLAAGDLKGAQEELKSVIKTTDAVSELSDDYISEHALMRVLASVGTQLSSFVHEINGLVGMTQSLDHAFMRLRNDENLTGKQRKDLGEIHSIIHDLRTNLERHASYLLDIITPDARRRRSRQSLAERFEAGQRLIEYLANKRSIEIANEIPVQIKSPAMFPAELTMVFSNLLTNAVKAAGEKGKIRAFAKIKPDKSIALIVENTGVLVNPQDGERWFRPFESTTTEVDAVLGQGMGLGLPITRSMLEEYGAEIHFTNPSQGFKTAVEIIFPE